MITEKPILASVVHYSGFPVVREKIYRERRRAYKDIKTSGYIEKMFAVMLEVIMCTLLMAGACLMVMGI